MLVVTLSSIKGAGGGHDGGWPYYQQQRHLPISLEEDKSHGKVRVKPHATVEGHLCFRGRSLFAELSLPGPKDACYDEGTTL